MDLVAAAIGMDPVDFRILNAAKEGTRAAYGPTYGPIGIGPTLEAVKNHPHMKAKLGKNQGRGMACGFWFNFGGQTCTDINIAVDGTVTVTVGTIDVGGSRASLTMIVAEELGMLGANGIVGGGPPIAMGAAFSAKFRKTNNVVVSFFGDGASNEGSVHEAANMAALYKLPCIFVCENNGYGEYTAQANHQAIVDVADRAAGYGMPGVVVDGMDVMAVYEAAGEAIERARNGGGPTLLECKTYRYYDHVGIRGMGMNYRTEEEVEEWKQRDAIQSFEKRLMQLKVMTAKQIQAVHDKVNKDIEGAIEFANNSPYPEPHELLENVYN